MTAPVVEDDSVHRAAAKDSGKNAAILLEAGMIWWFACFWKFF